MTKICFCGISGNGMSPLAQIMSLKGCEVYGSDRNFDAGRDGARLSHSRQKVVRVKALAAQGDEDGTRRDPAGVRHKRRGRKERLPFLSRRLQCGFGFPAKLPIHRRSPERRRVRRSTNTSRTTSASEKGWRTPLIS